MLFTGDGMPNRPRKALGALADSTFAGVDALPESPAECVRRVAGRCASRTVIPRVRRAVEYASMSGLIIGP